MGKTYNKKATQKLIAYLDAFDTQKEASKVSALLADGADPNAEGYPNVLGLAMRGKDDLIIQALIEGGLTLDLEVLHRAVLETCLPLIEACIEGGVELNHETPTHAYSPAFEAAIQQGELEIARRLVTAGAVTTPSRSFWALPPKDDKAVVDYLLDELGIDPNYETDMGPVSTAPDARHSVASLLYGAANDGADYAIKKLISAGAEVDERSSDGLTPLMVASRHGKTKAVKALLAGGADANLRSEEAGLTAAHYASFGGYGPCVKALIAAGADREAGITSDWKVWKAGATAAKVAKNDKTARLFDL